jgi:hypothetical protein
VEFLGRFSKHSRKLERLHALLIWLPLVALQLHEGPDRLTVYELADRFSIHRHTMSGILERDGVPRRCQKLSSDQIDAACSLYRSGLSLTKVSDQLGRRPETMRQTLMKARVEIRRNGRD